MVPADQMSQQMAQPQMATPPEPSSMPYKALNEEDVLSEFKERLRVAADHSRDWREEARELFDFEAGHQWEEEDAVKLREQNRPMVTFNLTSKFIDAVVGLQINNRQEIRCFPRTNGAAAVSDIATGAIAWCRDQCDAEYEDTDAGHDCLLTGMGWTEDFLDDRADPEGTISTERRDPLEMFWDPKARKKNLTDARYVIRLRRMSKTDYQEIFGEEPSGTIDVPGVDLNDPTPGLQIIDHPQDYRGLDDASSAQRSEIVVADYQFWCIHSYWKVAAMFPEGASIQQVSQDEWPQLKEQLQTAGVQHKAERIKVQRYYRCWITGNGIHDGIKDLPYQQGFTYHAITGKRERNKNLWYGLGRNLKDPQRWVNAFFSSIIWQLMVNPKGGLLAEEGAFSDPAEAEESWADPSKITFVTDGGIARVQPKPAGNYPQGMDRLMTFSMEALPGVSGINAELLGLTDRQQPGIVEAQRKQGALAIVAWYFDALRLHYKRTGRCMLSMIRSFIADGRLIRIVGQDGAQYVPLLRDKLTQTYDIIVDEAPTSVNMRDRVWTVLQTIIPMALQAGIKVPKEVLDYAPIPEDLASKWKQNLEPSPQEQQQQQQVQQIKMRQETAKAAKDEGSAAASQADAQLKTVEAHTGMVAAPTKIALDQVETIRKAAEAGALQAGGQ